MVNFSYPVLKIQSYFFPCPGEIIMYSLELRNFSEIQLTIIVQNYTQSHLNWLLYPLSCLTVGIGNKFWTPSTHIMEKIPMLSSLFYVQIVTKILRVWCRNSNFLNSHINFFSNTPKFFSFHFANTVKGKFADCFNWMIRISNVAFTFGFKFNLKTQFTTVISIVLL